jgi:hypothetical protein
LRQGVSRPVGRRSYSVNMHLGPESAFPPRPIGGMMRPWSCRVMPVSA